MRVKVKIPKNLTFAGLKRAVQNGLNEAALGVQADFETTVATWNTKPAFTIAKRGDNSRRVGTDSQIYAWVNDGTSPYTITGNPLLRFSVPFRAKTRRGKIGSNKGSRGNNVVVARTVRHPGIEAREFSTKIQEKWDGQLSALVQRAIDAEFS